eukprot:Phypoly_transcript_01964.p1 GENE.Phypoly_transcript_01964~~Phypoly_transcript_01964.p1  ORF type:complete len:979 (+),score=142.50 Phypoly_transcript_01964:32-2968(+)
MLNQNMDEDTHATRTESNTHSISQPATESNQYEAPADGPKTTPGTFGGGIKDSLKNGIILHSEFNLSNDINYGLSPPSTFSLPDEFPFHPPASLDDDSPLRAHTTIDNDDYSSPAENQRSYIYSNSYTDFTLLSGTPLTTQPINTVNDSPPSSPPVPSTPLRNSQQIYPGLSTTPLRTSLPLPNNSSPFPFTPVRFQPPMSAAVFSDSVPRLSSPPKLSALMLVGGSPSQYPSPEPSRFILTQSCPLPISSPLTPSPLSLHSRVQPFATPPPSQSFLQSDEDSLPPENALSPNQEPPLSQELNSFPPKQVYSSTASGFSRMKSPVSSLRKSAVLNSNTASYSSPAQRPKGANIRPANDLNAERDYEGEDEREDDEQDGKENKYLQPPPLSASDPIPDLPLPSSETTTSEETRAVDSEEERKRIILEILSTEESYVTFLRLIKMIYIWPLRDRIRENDIILTEAEIADLFANSETLLQVHITFLKQLRKRLRNYAPGVEVGDIFSEVGPYFKMYSTFVRSYFVKGIKLLRELNTNNKKFKAFALDAKDKCKRLDLSDLLLMPVQRLPRYVLLLESLIKKTPEDHADFQLLRNALALIKKVADQVNLGTVDDSESLAVLLRIQEALGFNAPKDLVQPHRKLVRQAVLPLMVDDGEQSLRTNVYLFNDLFLIVEDKTSNLLECIEISRIFVRKPAIVKGFSWGFEIYTSSWMRTFGLTSQEEEEQWLDSISKSIELLTKFHPLHDAHRVQAMKDIHAMRKMSVGEHARLFEQLATKQKNRSNPLPPLEHHNFVPAVEAPLTAHMMVEKMRLQQEEMMRENHFLFEKVESHPRVKRENTVTEFFKRMSLSQTQPLPQVRLPRPNQIVKAGYLTKQGGFIKNWKRRWFIMGNGHLYYTPDHMSNEVLGHIPLKGTVLEVDHDSAIRPFCMILHTFSRSYYICADGEKGMDEWVVAISTYFMSLATLHKITTSVPELPPFLQKN